MTGQEKPTARTILWVGQKQVLAGGLHWVGSSTGLATYGPTYLGDLGAH